MTRMHFQALAEAVRFLALSPADRLQVAEAIAGACRQFNSRFNRERFVRAATESTKAAEYRTAG